MISFDNIKEYSIEFPQVWTFLWSPEEADKIPLEHKDQIFFMNKGATSFLSSYLENNLFPLYYEPKIFPFKAKQQFKEDQFIIENNNKSELSKWLYNRGIPFDHYVFVYPDRSGYAVMMTWKMIMKYSEGLFFAEDLYIFDRTSNWLLSFDHNDILSFLRR